MNNRNPRNRFGFTLVELLVSTSLIGLILLLMVGTVEQTSKVWRTTQAKVSQFQSARVAFESLTRNLSQATLNTYWKQYDDPKTTPIDYKYVRESDLHFISGKASQTKLVGTRKAPERTGSTASAITATADLIHPTHALFFQAPLGRTSEESAGARRYRTLPNLLSAVGYFIEWGDDPSVPTPILAQVPPRYRFRLMEMDQPAETLAIYNKKAGGQAGQYNVTDWIQIGLGLKDSKGATVKTNTTSLANVRVMAENVVALVILPMLSERDRVDKNLNPTPTVLDLAPTYEYDSRPSDATGLSKLRKDYSDGTSTTTPEKRQSNQLPPLVHVILVAIDEASSQRQQDQTKAVPPDFTSGLFEKVKNEGELKKDLDGNGLSNVDSLVNRLAPTAKSGVPSTKPTMNYRVFEGDVVIRGAKWSNIQSQ